MPAAALAIPGLISAGTSIWGGINASKAAGKAANAQAGAYDAAGRLITDTTTHNNDQLSAAGQDSMKWIADAATWAGNVYTDAARAGADQVAGTADRAAAGVRGGVQQANDLLDPYIKGGTWANQKLRDLVDAPDEKFTFSQDDPSYQWRLKEGQRALEYSASAKGAAMGGAAARALARYGQGMASTEYQNEWERWRATKNDDRTFRTGILTNLTGTGAAAAGKAGDNTIAGERYAGDITTDASKFGAGLKSDAAKFTGSTNYDAAKTNAGINYGIASDIANNDMTRAKTLADFTLGKAGVTAAGILGQAQGRNQMISGIGQGALSIADLVQGLFKGKKNAAGVGGIKDSDGNYIGE